MAKKKPTLPPPARQREFPEVMTIAQLADYLQLHKQVVYRHVKNSRIPASRIGSTLRFKKSVIDAWLEESARTNLRSKGGESGAERPVSFSLEED